MYFRKFFLPVFVICLLTASNIPVKKAEALDLGLNTDKKTNSSSGTTIAPVQQVENELIAAYLGSDCSFVIGTLQGNPASSQDDTRRLLFGYPNEPGTSYPTVRVIDNGATNDFILTSLPASEGPHQENESVVCRWSLGTMDVIQRLTPVANPFSGRADTIRIEYEITNVSTRNVDAGLRSMLDMMIGENDYAPFFIPGQGNIVNELDFQSGSVPDFYKAFESSNFATDSLKGQGILRGYGATPPDRFSLATWRTGRGDGQGVFGSTWDYAVTPNAAIGDSTAVLWWNPKTLAPHQSIKYVTYFGLAGPGGGASWIDVPVEVSPASPNFQATLRVSNQTDQAFTGGAVTLTLPQGITSSEPLQQAFPDIQPGQTGSLSWNLSISNGVGGDLSISTATRFSDLTETLNAQAIIFIPPPPDPLTSRPVILVPGMGASYNSDLAKKYPGSTYDESKWGWTGMRVLDHEYGAAETYSGLINAFSHAGYSMADGYFTVAFYDWRGPVSDSGKRLKQVIEEVKMRTGASSVDLVAHSMGGLVAREYITSDYYQNDVSRLVTMGSPFNGSVNPYFYVGGGHLYGFDSLQSAVLQLFFLQPFRCDWLISRTPCWGRDVDVINNVATGLYDVLPNFEYIYDIESGQVKTLGNLYFKNQYLPKLNEKNQLLLTRAKVLTIAGIGQNTITGLKVRPFPPSGLMWQDGEPVEKHITTDGDGTVLKDSALIAGAENYTLPENHGGYPGNGEVQTKIFEFLGIRSPVGDFPSTYYASSLVIGVASPADITITDPQGRRLSPSEAQIPNAYYIGSGTEGPYAAVILDPLAGGYSINLTGTGDGEYHFIADYEVNDHQMLDSAIDYEFSGVIQSNAVVDISTQLNPAEVNPVVLISMSPTIELPAYSGSNIVNGYTTPGASVEVTEANGSVLGAGQSEQNGHFAVTLSSALQRGQIIVARANGKNSVPITIQDKPQHESSTNTVPNTSAANFPAVLVIVPLILGGLMTYVFVVASRRERKHSKARTTEAKLYIVLGQGVGRTISLRDNLIIGRSRISNIYVADPSVSRRHARIRFSNGQWFIQDMGSSSGVYVNGAKVNASVLRSGDHIRIGSTEFEFQG